MCGSVHRVTAGWGLSNWVSYDVRCKALKTQECSRHSKTARGAKPLVANLLLVRVRETNLGLQGGSCRCQRATPKHSMHICRVLLSMTPHSRTHGDVRAVTLLTELIHDLYPIFLFTSNSDCEHEGFASTHCSRIMRTHHWPCRCSDWAVGCIKWAKRETDHSY
jgi:hypothetical protein